MATLYWLSSQENFGEEPPVDVPDKWAHFIAYGFLGTLIGRTGAFWNRGSQGMWLAVLVASLYGASDEWHQTFVPGRYPDAVDWVADTLGAMLAIFLYAKWGLYRRFWEFRLFPRGKSAKENVENAGNGNHQENAGTPDRSPAA